MADDMHARLSEAYDEEPLPGDDQDHEAAAPVSPAASAASATVRLSQATLSVVADEGENDQPDEPRANRENCAWIFEQVARACPPMRYHTQISEEYPHNVTVACRAGRAPTLVIMRRRNGGYIAGPLGDTRITGDFINPADLPILRTTDREAIVDYARRYVSLTSVAAPLPPPAPRRMPLVRVVGVSAMVIAVSIACASFFA